MRAKKRTIKSDNNQDERSLSTPSHQRRRVQDVVFEVEDPFCPWNSGRYRLQADGDSVTCERTQASADLQLTAAELGAIFLGEQH